MAEHEQTHRVDQEHQPERGWLADFVLKLTNDRFLSIDTSKQERIQMALKNQYQEPGFAAYVTPEPASNTVVVSFAVFGKSEEAAVAMSSALLWNGIEEITPLENLDVRSLQLTLFSERSELRPEALTSMANFTEAYDALYEMRGVLNDTVEIQQFVP